MAELSSSRIPSCVGEDVAGGCVVRISIASMFYGVWRTFTITHTHEKKMMAFVVFFFFSPLFFPIFLPSAILFPCLLWDKEWAKGPGCVCLNKTWTCSAFLLRLLGRRRRFFWSRWRHNYYVIVGLGRITSVRFSPFFSSAPQ